MPNINVLLVDDEESILNSLKRLLIREEYDVSATTSPYEALHLLSTKEFSVLISDHRMPLMEGTVLLEKSREISPQTIRIMLTGYADMNAAMTAINQGNVYHFLTKPWDDNELKKVLKNAVEEFNTLAEQKNTAVKNKELRERYDQMVEKNLEQTHKNQQLSQELERSYIDSVEIIARSAKIYNAHLWRHLMGVTILCRKMAKLINLPRKQFLQLESAALLHDIGKLGMPDTLLKKPTKTLTPGEIDLINSHPLYGFSIVNMIPLFQEAACLIRHHHESYDGKGFPDGLHGEDIPAGSRIIAVADAYEKQVKSTYNQEYHFSQEAFDFLEAQSGKNFDPKAVSLLKAALLQDNPAHAKTKNREEIQYWQTALETEAEQFQFKPEGEIIEPIRLMHTIGDIEDSGLKSHDPIFKTPSQENEYPYSSFLSDNPLSDVSQANIAEPLPPPSPAHQAHPKTTIQTSPTLGQPFVSESIPDIYQDKDTEIPPKPIVADYEIVPVQIHQPTTQQSPATQEHKPIPAYPGLSYGYLKKRPAVPPEIKIDPAFLCAGMVLSRDLYTKEGKKLLDKNAMIRPDQIEKIKNFLKIDPPKEGLYIYKPN